MTLDQALDYARAVGLTDRQIAVVVRQEADRVQFKQDTGLVTLVNVDPELEGREIDAHPDALEQLGASGWVRKESLASPESPKAATTPKTAAKEK